MINIEQACEWFDNSATLVKSNKYKTVVADIINQTSFLPNDVSLPQRLYHIINNTSTIPGCKTCSKPVSWNRRYKRYNTYCGNSACPNHDPDVIAKKLEHTDYNKATKKRQQTNIERYGVSNYLASQQGLDKSKQTKIEKYGADYTAIEQQHREQTMIERYGVSNYFSIPGIQSSIIQIKKQKYGTTSNNIKRQRTVRDRYGVDNAMQIKYAEYDGLFNNPDWLLDQHLNKNKSFAQISSELNGIDPTALINKVRSAYPDFIPTRFPVSTYEHNIVEFLQSHDIKCLTGDRTTISPYELDIYVPTHKIAIEVCGVYWHSEQQGRDRNYHKRKMELCAKQGIRLITIFSDELDDKTELVYHKLLNILNIDDTTKCFARQCTIINVTTNDKNKFLNANHIQGTGPGSITYGLCYDNKLVAVMSFIKQDSQFILNRYATSVRVVGGFSKLLSHFKHNNKWSKIISFADLRWSMGDLYTNTGWILDGVLPPDYTYSPDGKVRIHKFNYRRKYLPKLLKTFDPALSETQNCDNNGILRIWDCGKLRFVMFNQQP